MLTTALNFGLVDLCEECLMLITEDIFTYGQRDIMANGEKWDEINRVSKLALGVNDLQIRKTLILKFENALKINSDSFYPNIPFKVRVNMSYQRNLRNHRNPWALYFFPIYDWLISLEKYQNLSRPRSKKRAGVPVLKPSKTCYRLVDNSLTKNRLPELFQQIKVCNDPANWLWILQLK